MRILLLTQWFQPEPFFKGLPFANELILQGHDVEVLTGFPNYPGGKVYPGYRIRWFQREMIEGIRVNRVPLYPSHNASGVLRILNYFSFSICALLLGPFVIRRPDVIYVYNLPTLGFVANIFKLLFKSKVVLDIQDLWPESVTQSKMMNNRIALALLAKAVNAVYSSADRITVLSPGFRKNLTARGIDARKISVIYNWCNETETSLDERGPAHSTNYFPEGCFNVVFAGTMGKMQALESVIEAASIVEKRNANVRFWFIGGGIELESLKFAVASRKISNVGFIPRVSQNEISSILQTGDLLLVHLKKESLFAITIPSKIQAYMYVGRPILAAVTGDAARLVETAEAGLACEPENASSIAEAVLKISAMNQHDLHQLGQNGKSFYRDNLSMKCGVNSFVGLFRELVKIGE
jgi:colanic acid biosynthesis glycosyl transferase WcaI